MKLSPISPSGSALGISAATESTTTNVDSSGRDERARDLESLLAIVGLRDEKIIDIHAELACVNGIESMLCVDKGGRSARRLGLGDDLERDSGFAGRFRTEDLHDAPARESADAQGRIDGNGSGRADRDSLAVAGAKLKHGPFAELLLHLEKRLVNQFAAVGGRLHLNWCVEEGENLRGKTSVEGRALEGDGPPHFIGSVAVMV